MAPVLTPELAAEDFCYLSTTGRVTGRPHTIEIWFAAEGGTLYLLSGSDRSDWVRNLRADPSVTVRVGGRELVGSARVVTDPVERAPGAQLVYAKYQPGYGGDLRSWRDRALLVAVEID